VLPFRLEGASAYRTGLRGARLTPQWGGLKRHSIVGRDVASVAKRPASNELSARNGSWRLRLPGFVQPPALTHIHRMEIGTLQ
jgi:hypothetical protein